MSERDFYQEGKAQGQQFWEHEPLTREKAQDYADGVLDQLMECIEEQEEGDGASGDD